MKKIADRGSVSIGVSVDQPLLGLADVNGVPQGFDVEIARLIAHSLGLNDAEITWVPVTAADRVSVLADRDVDFVVSSFAMTLTNEASVGFGGPYYVAGQSIMVNTGDTTITGKGSVVGRSVCAVASSAAAEKLASLRASVVLVDSLSQCIEPLRSGAVEAVSSDNVLLEGFRAANPGQFELVGSPFTVQPYGVGIRRNDLPFKYFIDDVLEESYADGTYKALWQKTAGKTLGFVSPPTISSE
ncbi:transporter substrate-binding domain-containing protein, partial [Agreia sp.]|uniref:transporter substrate-binding domain-containing protein n=1 Tax=Agreia sp. TaxID=1872416 RepID=UPI0035BBCF24